LHNLALFWVKNANFFAIFFGENIFKIITSVPGYARKRSRALSIALSTGGRGHPPRHRRRPLRPRRPLRDEQAVEHVPRAGTRQAGLRKEPMP
jgi:hypothetical protein